MTRTKGESPALEDGSFTKTDSYETISDLMTLQDQIDTFQKLVFSNFQGGANNECRISALVPLVQESYGIYKFITSMLRAMHTSWSPNGIVAIIVLTANSDWRRRCSRATEGEIRYSILSPTQILLRMFKPQISHKLDQRSEAGSRAP